MKKIGPHFVLGKFWQGKHPKHCRPTTGHQQVSVKHQMEGVLAVVVSAHSPVKLFKLLISIISSRILHPLSLL
jgi:hypothetical protein